MFRGSVCRAPLRGNSQRSSSRNALATGPEVARRRQAVGALVLEEVEGQERAARRLEAAQALSRGLQTGDALRAHLTRQQQLVSPQS